MPFVFEERRSDSPHVDLIWQTHSEHAGTFTSTAGSTWELVITTVNGTSLITARGPETKASAAAFPADAAFLGITFTLGAFMPQLPVKTLLDRQDATLPAASRTAFWLQGAAWELPTFDNADVFVHRLIRQGILVRDPLVAAALQGQTPALSRRALQYRFVQATGLPHKTIQQIERARRAAALLQQGVPIVDTALELGYFDQAHLTNALKRFIVRLAVDGGPGLHDSFVELVGAAEVAAEHLVGHGHAAPVRQPDRLVVE